MKSQIVEIVTGKIMEALEKGTPPWDSGWQLGAHKNHSSGYIYRGINRVILQSVLSGNNYTRPLWITYKQSVEMGGQIRKGEHGYPVVLWKMIHPKDAENEDKIVPLLRYFTVFNVEQIS